VYLASGMATIGTGTITTSRDGDVLTATIDHPDSAMNAVDARLHHDLGELFRVLKRESEARAVVLIGTGRVFSAGGDMAWFPTLRDAATMHRLRREAKQLVWDLLDVEVPASPRPSRSCATSW
jgi:enoyl-CoA hydratase